MSPMIPGLSAADSAKYTTALGEDCDVRVLVINMTMSHVVIAAIEPLMLDGQINVTQADGTNVTKVLQMGFLDPDHALRLDSGSPSAGVGGLDRLIQVKTYLRSGATLGAWIGAPAFTGRPSSVARDGDTVTIEAQGKESLHLRTTGRVHIGKGAFVVNAVKAILQRSGETRFRFPTITAVPNKLPSIFYYGGPDETQKPWRRAFGLAQSVGLQLYYDTTGHACLRPYPAYGGTPAWTLVEQGADANTLARVKNTTDLTTIRNQVVVYGKTNPVAARAGRPAQASRLLTGVKSATATHNYSGQALGMNGHTWYNTEFITNDDLHTQAAVDAHALAKLGELLVGATDIETATLPVWHLEPLDILRMRAAGDTVDFRLKNASIPLGPSDTGMTVGYRFSVRSPSAGRLRA